MSLLRIPDYLDDETILLPEQYAAMLQNPHNVSPERRLILAVIEDALRLITHKPPPRAPTGQTATGYSVKGNAQTWWRTYDWLIDLNSRHPFSLVWVCEALSGKHDDPFAIAKRIADKVKASQGFEVASRRPVSAPRGMVPMRRRKRPSQSA